MGHFFSIWGYYKKNSQINILLKIIVEQKIFLNDFVQPNRDSEKLLQFLSYTYLLENYKKRITVCVKPTTSPNKDLTISALFTFDSIEFEREERWLLFDSDAILLTLLFRFQISS